MGSINGSDDKVNMVDGYLFRSEEDADLARQEQKKCQYLAEHMDMDDAETVMKVYQKAIEMRTFRTPVGMKFVYELRETLLRLDIPEEDIPGIPIYEDYNSKLRREAATVKKRVQPKAQKEKIDKTKISVILNILLVILVIGMFYIAKTGDNPNIINFENNLINKYASWEQELTEREKNVRQKEHELQLVPEDTEIQDQ